MILTIGQRVCEDLQLSLPTPLAQVLIFSQMEDDHTDISLCVEEVMKHFKIKQLNDKHSRLKQSLNIWPAFCFIYFLCACNRYPVIISL